MAENSNEVKEPEIAAPVGGAHEHVLPPAEAGALEPKVEEEIAKAPKYAGGEIHIVADGNTGAMSVTAPPDLIIALGILEVAKAFLVDNMKQKVAQAQRDAAALVARPAIVPASSGQLKDLDRRLGRGARG